MNSFYAKQSRKHMSHPDIPWLMPEYNPEIWNQTILSIAPSTLLFAHFMTASFCNLNQVASC